jgi:hypothetical protein
MNSERGASSSVNPQLMAADAAAAKSNVIGVVRLSRRFLQASALGLALLFTWLKFRGLNFTPVLNDISAQLLLRSTLAVYYMSWVFGLSSDADDQELLYVKAPNRSRAIALLIGTVLMIAVPFGILCYVQTYRTFAAVLSAFLVFNVVIWLLLIYKVLPEAVRETTAYYKANQAYPKIVVLRLFYDDYLQGSWQHWRFLTGGILVALIDLFAFSDVYQRLKLPALLRDKDFVLALLVFIFVAVIELWMWAQRMQFRVNRSLVEQLSKSYSFRPIKSIENKSDLG